MRFACMLALVLALAATGTAVAKMPYDAVCSLMKGDGNSGGGSGTLIIKNTEINKGIIITCAHILYDSADMIAYWPNYGEKGEARVAFPIFVDYTNDVALMVVDDPPGEAVSICGTYELNDPMYPMGFPWHSRRKLQWQKTDLVYWGQWAATVKPPTPGMSGGGVFAKSGGYLGHVLGRTAKKEGRFCTLDVDLHVLMTFRNPDTWKPIKNHFRDVKSFKFSPKSDDDKEKTEEYSESDAPDLEPTIETKVPAAK